MAVHILKNGESVLSLDAIDELENALISLANCVSEDAVADVDVVFDGALYSLSHSLVLDAEKAPALKRIKISFRASDGEKPMITSLSPIDASLFTKVGEGVYKCTLPKDENGKYPVFRTLYNGASRMPLSRSATSIHPNGFVNHYAGRSEEECKDYKGLYVEYDVAKRLADAKAVGSAELMMLIEWEFIIMRVTGVDLSETIEHEGKTYALITLDDHHMWMLIMWTNMCIGIKDRPLFIANHPAYITPNSYAYDYRTGELTVGVPEGKSIEDMELSFPVLENLITLRHLKNTSIEGITFTGIDSFYVCENGYHSRQANNEKRVGMLPHAAVYTSCMTDFAVRKCDFHDIGANGLLMKDRNVRITVESCCFRQIAMSALAVGTADLPWDDPMAQNFEITVTNNFFSHIGYEYPAAVAFYITLVDGLFLTHNTFEKTAYSAVSAGWGWSLVDFSLGEGVNIRNAEIAYNRIEDCMEVLHDGAAIYVVGANCHKGYARQINFMHDNFAVRREEERAKHAYYLDGSSSNWEVYDNVTHGADLSVFSQFNVRDQYTWHNYIHDIYSTKQVPEGNCVPERDMRLGECFVVTEGLDKLFEKYPKSREIYENSGCRGCTEK